MKLDVPIFCYIHVHFKKRKKTTKSLGFFKIIIKPSKVIHRFTCYRFVDVNSMDKWNLR
jgi:hypothetical protein